MPNDASQRMVHREDLSTMLSEISGENTADSFRGFTLLTIQDARITLDRPVIEGPDFERESKFWCYFCTEEISKHLVLDVCVLKFGGLLEHIACLEHKKKMYGFFYDNRVDETQRHPDLFFLQTEQLKR
ncbi:hypothetical protein FSP39_021181 [Pinctada imbricata]|uniref:Uncharacterized protein n=1 Tax=Pinctada imbricata TaxID=66713 RepID=A0AA88YW81_PINIB|nr:hypothetical protein FSP39_021181 [Pinctada imbricata]